MKYKKRTFLLPSLKFILSVCMGFILSSPVNAASIATAGQDDGYSGRILDKIVSKWKIPRQARGDYRLKLILSVDGDGRLLDCRVQNSSGLKTLDNSVCEAAKAASPYGSPPYGMPATVYFSFWSGAAGGGQSESVARSGAESQSRSVSTRKSDAPQAQHENTGAINKKKQRYISKITKELRNSIYIPVETRPGVYHVSAQIECDRQGNIISSNITKPCNDARLNKYVLQGIRRAKKVSPPEEAFGNKFNLNFTLVRQGADSKKGVSEKSASEGGDF